MVKFRKKPVEIEAIQFVGGKFSSDEIQNWAIKYNVVIVWYYNYNTLNIPTLEGKMSASVGDWIIKGVSDEFYPCKPNIFEETYEAIENE